MTTPAGGGQIHKEIAAEGGKLITITGHGDELIRKIIVTYPTGEEVVIRGFVTEQDNGFVVDQGFINGELMPETMLEGMTADLNDTSLNVVYAKQNAPKGGVGDFFSGGRTPRASDLSSWAESQGWTASQTANGPLKYTDSSGVVRLTIKGGSDRAPGSAGPHIEVRDATGQRINPRTGEPVTRRSPDNHTEIDYDL
ncbi:hypothetical protein [Pseudovibrio exalbescens]|nr:hypothetical protein [Pseudovibrio exalbescens]